jgi:hypothetical protein
MGRPHERLMQLCLPLCRNNTPAIQNQSCLIIVFVIVFIDQVAALGNGVQDVSCFRYDVQMIILTPLGTG